MIVVHFEEIFASHGCWGEYEHLRVRDVCEFETVEDWLKYRSNKNIKLITLYVVNEVVRGE